MNAPAQPTPQAIQPEQPQGQVVPAQPANITNLAYTQMQQVAPYVPPAAWTEKAVLELHSGQKEVAIKNIESLNDERRRENLRQWAVLFIGSAIIGFGCYLAAHGNPLGEKIIGGTLIFIAGFAAGQGHAKSQLK